MQGEKYSYKKLPPYHLHVDLGALSQILSWKLKGMSFSALHGSNFGHPYKADKDTFNFQDSICDKALRLTMWAVGR